MSQWQVILTATDFSERSEVGVRTAADLAKRLGSQLVLAYAVEDRMPPVLDEATRKRAITEHRKLAESNLGVFAERVIPDAQPQLVVESGRPHEVILELARWRDIDLIVLATHGYGLVGQAFLGSTTERVIRRASCPVMAVKSEDNEEETP